MGSTNSPAEAAQWPLSSSSNDTRSAPSPHISPEFAQAAVVDPPQHAYHHAPPQQQHQHQQYKQYQQYQQPTDFAPPSHFDPALALPTNQSTYNEKNGWKWTRIVLHALCVVASIGGLAVSGILSNAGDSFGNIREAAVALFVCLFTLILAIVELLARFVPQVKRENGLNPNVAVAGWLVAAWSAIPTVAILAFDIALWYTGSPSNEGPDWENTYLARLGSTPAVFFNRLLADTILVGIVAIASFTLWIGACVEAAQYNRSLGAARSSYVDPKQADAAASSSSVRVFSNAWGRFKLVLNGLGLIFCVIGGALSVSLLAYLNMTIDDDSDNDTPWDGYSYRHDNSYDEVASTFPFFSVMFFVPMLWIVAELCTILGRKWKAGIHPGAHVAIWLIFSVGIALGAASMLSVGPISTKCHHNINRPTTDGDEVSVSKNPGCVAERGIAAASIVFAWLMAIVAIFLFIAACADTAVRNATGSKTVVYVPFQAQGMLASGDKAMDVDYNAPPARPAQIYAPSQSGPSDEVWQPRQ